MFCTARKLVSKTTNQHRAKKQKLFIAFFNISIFIGVAIIGPIIIIKKNLGIV